MIAGLTRSMQAINLSTYCIIVTNIDNYYGSRWLVLNASIVWPVQFSIYAFLCSRIHSNNNEEKRKTELSEQPVG